jgi:hypothetical protein
MESWIGAAYLDAGQPERWAELCSAQLERRGDDHVYIRACLVFGLVFSGRIKEAFECAEGLIEAGVTSGNPYMHSFATGAVSHVLIFSEDTAKGLEICREGLTLAQETGNRFNVSILAMNLARLEARGAVSAEALNHLTLVIRNYHDSGNVASLRSPLGVLSGFLNRLGRFEPAAILAGYAASPLAMAA